MKSESFGFRIRLSKPWQIFHVFEWTFTFKSQPRRKEVKVITIKLKHPQRFRNEEVRILWTRAIWDWKRRGGRVVMNTNQKILQSARTENRRNGKRQAGRQTRADLALLALRIVWASVPRSVLLSKLVRLLCQCHNDADSHLSNIYSTVYLIDIHFVNPCKKRIYDS